MVMPQSPDKVTKRSAQDVPHVTSEAEVGPVYGMGDVLSQVSMFAIAQFADDIVPWGLIPKLRDVQLREFVPSESILASAFATVASRNAAFSWRFDGGPRQVQKAQDLLQYANFGRGYRSLITQFTYDLLGQDNAAFIEVIRAKDSPTGEVIGLANLDSGRCWRTGDPARPVLYTNLKGDRHLLPWWRVMPFAEMPSPIERLRGLQYSAATRILKAAQFYRDIVQFQREKMAGRRPQQIHFVSGIATDAINDAIVKAQARADNPNLYRYMDPIMVQGLNPNAPVQVATVELASLPLNFDATAAFNQYVDQMAMALLIDRQDLAPLTGGNIGTSTQSEVLAEKTRGKGPGLFMKLLEDAFNFQGIFGKGVTFTFDEQDLTQDRHQAEVDKLRAEGRKVYIDSGVLTAQIVRQQMVDDGELDEEYLELLGEEDVTDESTGDDSAPVDAQADVEVTVTEDAVPPAAQLPLPAPAANPLAQIRAASPAVVRKDPQHIEMDRTEESAAERFAASLAKTHEAFSRAVKKQLPKQAVVVAEVRAVAEEAQRAIHDQARNAEITLKATVEDVQEIVGKAVTEAAAVNARAIDASAAVNAESTAQIVAVVQELARPKRRRVVRDERGIALYSTEETIDG